MDGELAGTLAELERKLAELEQTLADIGGRTAAAPAPAAVAAAAAGPVTADRVREAAAAAPLAEPLSPYAAGARLVDEALEGVGTGVSLPPSVGAATAGLAPLADYVPADARPPAPGVEPVAGGAGEPVVAGPARVEPETEAGGGTRWVSTTAPSPLRATAQAVPAPGAEALASLLRFRERLEESARDLTREYDELLGRLSYPAVTTIDRNPVSFARGAPSLDIVDVHGLREAADRAFEHDPGGTTAYGTSVGYPRLRNWIANRHGVDPEHVLVTNGSMQADAFLFEHLVRPGSEVVVERPTYDRTLLSLRQRGAQLHAVALEPDGIDVEALARLLDGGARPSLAHIIPNFQNPAGYTLSLAKRERLLELAAAHGFMVFEDDPYVALRFSGEQLPRMVDIDPERVVYASSFSKTVCPGIRVGYLVGPRGVIKAIGELATNTYISPSMVSQAIVYEFCASGALERSIETVKAALSQRAGALAAALRRELPEARFVEPQGGYFMWVTLPEGTDVAALFTAAAERGVAFVKGTDFLLEGGENTMRLAYSGVTPEQIEAGVARLAEAYRSL